jgi:hypothetical protein
MLSLFDPLKSPDITHRDQTTPLPDPPMHCVGEPVGLEMIAEDFGAFININIKTCGRYKLRLDWPNACSEIRISYSDQPIASDERR